MYSSKKTKVRFLSITIKNGSLKQIRILGEIICFVGALLTKYAQIRIPGTYSKVRYPIKLGCFGELNSRKLS